jgi:copper homeostasis protein
MLIEICVDSLDSAVTAEKGGADRVELCSDLLEGGITPSSGLIQAVRSKIDIPIFVMIRPRGGDLYFSASEFDIMVSDLREAKRLGADGVVLGLLTTGGQVDVERTSRLVEMAYPMQVTFHRAIDMAPDMEQACEDIVLTGAHRILTSGGKETAQEGAAQIARLVQIAHGRIGIMVGSGIRAHNVQEVARLTGAKEFHGSLRRRAKSPVSYFNPMLAMGLQNENEFYRYTLLEDDVRALRQAVDSTIQLASPSESVQ